jgi:hypothetical protein
MALILLLKVLVCHLALNYMLFFIACSGDSVFGEDIVP